jgi:16S rRNA (cytosine1402-N4)-methyltransferase
MEFIHKPIMLHECMELLNIKKDGIYVDGTVGGAGHSSSILSMLGKGGRLIAIDRDSEAVETAKERLAKVETQGEFTVVKARYSQTADVLQRLGVGKVNGILLDIGVSSYQLDNPDRGFGYMTEGKPDMRMGADEPIRTAYDIINEADQTELERIIRDYGEERYWKRIAQKIVSERKKRKNRNNERIGSHYFGGNPGGGKKRKTASGKKNVPRLAHSRQSRIGGTGVFTEPIG